MCADIETAGMIFIAGNNWHYNGFLRYVYTLILIWCSSAFSSVGEHSLGSQGAAGEELLLSGVTDHTRGQEAPPSPLCVAMRCARAQAHSECYWRCQRLFLEEWVSGGEALSISKATNIEQQLCLSLWVCTGTTWQSKMPPLTIPKVEISARYAKDFLEYWQCDKGTWESTMCSEGLSLSGKLWVLWSNRRKM